MAPLGGDAHDGGFHAISHVNDNISTLFQHNTKRGGIFKSLFTDLKSAGLSVISSELFPATTTPPLTSQATTISSASTTTDILSPTENQTSDTTNTVASATPTESSTTNMATSASQDSTSTTSSGTPVQSDPPTRSSSITALPSIGQGVVGSTTIIQSTSPIITQVINQTGSSITRDHMKTPLIIGSVIGAVVLLSVLIVVAACFRRRYRSNSRRRSLTESDGSVQPYTTPSRAQGNSTNKLRAEDKRMRTYPLADADHQEVADRDGGPLRVEGDNGGQGNGRELVIGSDDNAGQVPLHPPPSYMP